MQHTHMYAVFIVQAYQTSQYAVPRGCIFVGNWRSSFAGSSDGKMNVQSACALNTRYICIMHMNYCKKK
jgi:L-asparaginase/Glu-tRNA(Gln) amidotransferase subunit D